MVRQIVGIGFAACLMFGLGSAAFADRAIPASQAKCVDAAAQFAVQHLNRHSHLCQDWQSVYYGQQGGLGQHDGQLGQCQYDQYGQQCGQHDQYGEQGQCGYDQQGQQCQQDNLDQYNPLDHDQGERYNQGGHAISSRSTGYGYQLYDTVYVKRDKELVQFVAYLPGDDDPSVLEVEMRYDPYANTCSLLDLDEEDEIED